MAQEVKTKQEVVREEIKRISCRGCEQISYCKTSCGVPEEDLERLSKMGVVIKVEVESEYDPFPMLGVNGEEIMAEVKAVVPLIKDK